MLASAESYTAIERVAGHRLAKPGLVELSRAEHCPAEHCPAEHGLKLLQGVPGSISNIGQCDILYQ